MTDLAIIPTTDQLDQYADAGRFVELACERAKDWLRQALERGDIDGIVDLKSQAEAIRTYTVQKQLGKDAELSAAEIVRRAERGIGLAIRKGQEEGEFRIKGETATRANQYGTSAVAPIEKKSGMDFFGNASEMTDAYAVTDDVTEEQFEEAIDEAREEGNLSRANVVKAVARKKAGEDSGPSRLERIRDMAGRGYTSGQIAAEVGHHRDTVVAIAKRNGITIGADAVMGRTRLLDSNRIVAGIVESVDSFSLLDRIDYSALDADLIPGWVASLQGAVRSLTTLRNNLNKEHTSREQQ